jgi:hypothetical protein
MIDLKGRLRHLRLTAIFFVMGTVAFGAGVGATNVYRIVTERSPTPAPSVDSRIATNLRVAISTSATPVSGERVAWTSMWTLCWDPLPGAVGYEIQAVTWETVSTRIRRVEAPCFSVELAAGEDVSSEVEEKRDTQLAVHRSQLAYRVRADFGGNVVGAWSRAIDAGSTGIR